MQIITQQNRSVIRYLKSHMGKKIHPSLLVALKSTQPKPENVIFISIRCILKYYFKRNFALTMYGMQEKLFPKAIPLKEHSNILNINMFK